MQLCELVLGYHVFCAVVKHWTPKRLLILVKVEPLRSKKHWGSNVRPRPPIRILDCHSGRRSLVISMCQKLSAAKERFPVMKDGSNRSHITIMYARDIAEVCQHIKIFFSPKAVSLWAFCMLQCANRRAWLVTQFFGDITVAANAVQYAD